MKTRLGFVSNSSSSSFLMYGICVDEDTLHDVFRTLSKSLIDEDKKVLDILDEDENNDRDTFELCEEISKKLGNNMGFWDNSEQGDFYFGRSWDEIGDDETGRQFKESIQESLRKVFGKDIVPSTHQEEIMN
jgi:hypothetical protein